MSAASTMHQYVHRETGQVCTERLIADRVVQWLYSPLRERAPLVFKALTSRYVTGWLGFWQYDLASLRPGRTRRLAHELGVDLSELEDPEKALRSARHLFERQIRYWECRPMPPEEDVVVSPADARCLIGSHDPVSPLFLKEKFFTIDELLGDRGTPWYRVFERGDYAIFRLTPDKYHYNHTPAAGCVVDFYEVDGAAHSCNPAAVVIAQPHAKNRRMVTVFDTDVPGGTGIGYVAMIEVVALMIGDITQCYSVVRYEQPRDMEPFLFVERGCPKSLYHPGSSVTVLLFQKGRVQFAADLVQNSRRLDVQSRYIAHFQRPLVETDVRVRSEVARKQNRHIPISTSESDRETYHVYLGTF